MFGNLGAFVHGNMFMGLFGSEIGIKLARSDGETFKATEDARPFGPAERPMGGYLTLPVSLTADPRPIGSPGRSPTWPPCRRKPPRSSRQPEATLSLTNSVQIGSHLGATEGRARHRSDGDRHF